MLEMSFDAAVGSASRSMPLIIIPYRDRYEHLCTFLPHIYAFFKEPTLRVVVIEQCDSKPFNRGKLLNVAFALTRSTADSICFHDIDMLPQGDSCDYSPCKTVAHLAGRVEQFGYKMPYPEYLGGVLLTTAEAYIKANGYCNEYWGWGNEDDDLFVRYRLAGITIDRRSGLYRSLGHPKGTPSLSNVQRLVRSLRTASRIITDTAEQERLKIVLSRLPKDNCSNEGESCLVDGLSTLRFKIIWRGALTDVIQLNRHLAVIPELIRVEL
jgi:N-terminal domain of galactosyltransferase/N-terminal region of glycosyl transferase group 7